MNSYENKILEAVEIITNQKIDEADFNKTVQAVVRVEVRDGGYYYYLSVSDGKYGFDYTPFGRACQVPFQNFPQKNERSNECS